MWTTGPGGGGTRKVGPADGRRPIPNTEKKTNPSFGSELWDRPLFRWFAHRRKNTSHVLLVAFAVVGVTLSLGHLGAAGTPAVVKSAATQPASYLSAASIGFTGRGSLPASDEPGAAATPTSAPVQSLTYEVQAGDTLNAIAEKYGVDPEYLIWNNPEVGSDPDSLVIGEKLLIPGEDGIVYNVTLGDTITDIASTYGIDPESVISYGPNDLASPDLITDGMVLLLPGGVPPAPAAPYVADDSSDAAVDDGSDSAQPASVGEAAVPATVSAPDAPAPSAFTGYIWPVAGHTINSPFGPRWGSFHTGVDIGASYGDPVWAAADAQVVLTVYGDAGYGNYVILKHDDGSQTLYAHFSAIYVRLGQYVSQGESDRRRRLHRLVHRPPPPLRGAHRRCPG